MPLFLVVIRKKIMTFIAYHNDFLMLGGFNIKFIEERYNSKTVFYRKLYQTFGTNHILGS